jgi:hypothetical protein
LKLSGVKRGAAVEGRREVATSQSLDCIRQWMDQQFKPARIAVQDAVSPAGFRYQVEQGFPSPTLYVPQQVLEAHPAEDIIAALNRHHVAERLRFNPIAQLVCVASTGGIVVVRRQRG